MARTPGWPIRPDGRSTDIVSGPGMVGRSAQLVVLDRRLAEAAEGFGGLILLTGEPGIGKTHFADEATLRARRLGFRAVTGRCRETEGAPPFWPWTQVLRAVRSGSAREPLSALRPILDAEPGPETDRSRLFDAMTRLLAEESLDRPLLIVLDDLHRADHASLGLLRFLAPIVRDSRLLVIGTYRGGEIPTAHPLTRLVADVVGGVGVDVLALEGLTRQETALLVARMAPAGASLSVEELQERSGGNPFFLTEILRLAPEAMDEVPATVSAAISARLDRLPAQTRRVLILAAVVGRDFTVGLLARVDGVSEDSTCRRLTAAIAAGVVAPIEARDGAYRFTHVLVREVLYDALSAPRRTELHNQVICTLERSDLMDMANPVEVATHAVRVLRTPEERLRASRLVVRAADQAGDRLAHEESADWLRRALELGTADDEERFGLLVALGRAAGRAYRVDAARAAYRQAWTLAECDGPAGRLAEVALGLGDAVVSTGMVDPVLVGMLEEALERADPADRQSRIRMSARLAVELYWSDRLPTARRLSGRAVAAARRLGDPASLVAALAARQVTLRGPDQLDERIRAGAELIDLAHRLGDEQAELHARRLALADHLQVGPEPAAAALQEQALFAERTRLPLAQWYLMVSRSIWDTLAGRYEDALRTVAEAEAFGRRIGAPPAAVYAALQRFAVLHPLGRAIEVADELRAGIRAHPGVIVQRCTLSLALAQAGQREEADALLTDLVAQRCAVLPRDAVWLSCLASLTMTAAALNRKNEAATLYALLRPHSGRIVQQGVVAWWGAVDHYLGLAAAVLGQRHDAETALRAGLRLHEAWGAVPQIAASLQGLARQRASGSSAEKAAGLTEREWDVLRLLATGAANKQIARELHISVHTVERHVVNLYAKIDVSNRAAATAFALRHQ